MSTADTITWGKVAKKAPTVVKDVPHIIRGLLVGRARAPHVPRGLGWAFEKATRSNPGGDAILYENVRFTYEEANQWANRYAHYLLHQGIRKGDVVAVFVENRPELLIITLALAKLGAVGAMLNTSQTGPVLVHSINLVAPKAAIVGEEKIAVFDDVKNQLTLSDQHLYFLSDTDTTVDPGIAPSGYINLATESAGFPARNPETTQQVYGDDPCFYIYTSGTTGLPKAGIFKHGRWMKVYAGFGISSLNMNPNDVMYSTLPLYHATGLCVCWGSAISGASGFAIRRKFSARNFWSDTRKFNATTIGYVGELCRYLVDHPPQPDDANNPVYKMVGNGLRPNVWNEFVERFSVEKVYEFYAASDGNIGFSNVFNFNNTIGYSPISWELVKYDKEQEAPVRGPDGFMVKAEKHSEGLLISRITDRSPLDGYTDPEKTKKVIFQDVFKKGDRWFNTGDILRNIGFGHCQFVDRLGDTFRWKGENVSTTEIENILSEHKQVAEAVVYGVEIPNTNGRAGMASITFNTPVEDIDFAGMYQYCKDNMPAYAIPLFIRVKQQLETTGTFKYQKSHLKEQAYYPERTNGEPVYGLLPGAKTYVELTKDIIADIDNGNVRY